MDQLICIGYGDTVTVINTTTNTVTATVSVGSRPNYVAITSMEQSICDKFYSNNVSVINTSTNTVIKSNALNVGIYPNGVSITPMEQRYMWQISAATMSL